MGETKDQVFTYNMISGEKGDAGIENGVIVMNIAGNGSNPNGIHESSHGYDLWKGGINTQKNAIDREIKTYSRQFSYNKKSLPISDFGKANTLNDINQKWVYGINPGGDYIYIKYVFGEKVNVKQILYLLKTN